MDRRRYRLVILATAIFAFAIESAQAQWGQAVLDSVCVGSSNDNLGVNALALDSLRNLHLVYEQAIGTDHNLYYKKKPFEGVWSEGLPIGNQTLAQSSPYLTVHKYTGVPNLVYIEAGVLKLGIGGTTWTYQDLPLPSTATLVGHPAITLDVAGRPHVAVIVEIGGEYKIGYIYSDSQNFHAQVIAGSQLGPFGSGAAPDITTNPDGGALISYRAGDYGAYRIDVAENHQIGGTNWDFQAFQPAGFNNFTSSIRSRSYGVIYLAFDGNQGWGFPGHVFYCQKLGSQPWSNPVDITGSYGGMDCRIAVQSSGIAHVVWQKTSGNLLTGEIIYATNLTGSWVSQILQAGNKYTPSLVVDTWGDGSLAFEQAAGAQNDDVFYYGYVAPPIIEVTLSPLNPPIVIPAQGGAFDYQITLTNTTTGPVTFLVWISVGWPDGGWGNLGYPTVLTFPAGLTATRVRIQLVPGEAMPGQYTYRAQSAYSITYIYDYDQFTFIKSPSGSGAGANDWLLTGDPFPGEGDARPSIMSTGKMAQPIFVQVSPNPFNPTTAISYQLSGFSHVSLRIYDIGGRLVTMLADGWFEAGLHIATFDGQDLAAGIYLYRLEAEGQIVSGKMVMVR